MDLSRDLTERLANAGIRTVSDLLHRFPYQIDTLGPIHGAGRSFKEGLVAIGGRRGMACSRLHPDGTRDISATLLGAGRTPLAWKSADEGERWLKSVPRGARVVVTGHWDGLSVWDPQVVVEDQKAVRVAKYGIQGVSDKEYRALLYRFVSGLKSIREPMPWPVGLEQGEALRGIHFCGDVEAARARLALDEAASIALVAEYQRRAASGQSRGLQHAVLHSAVDRILTFADHRLGDAQQAAFDDIKRDLRQNRPMRRVLFGGPGGRKGLVALLAAAIVAEGKCQVAWIGADRSMVERLYVFSKPLFEAAEIQSAFVDRLTGSTSEALRKGEVSVVFGTPELIDSKVEYRRLGLVIVDETTIETQLQGRAGNHAPDLLIVPRRRPTGAMLLNSWREHDLSLIEGAPAPTVQIFADSERDAAYDVAREALHFRDQVAVVFPQLDGTDALDPREASRMMNYLGANLLNGAKMALYHGAMPRREQLSTLADFSHRTAEAILATAPIEDAVPIPALKVVIVEHAHRFSPQRLQRIVGLNVREMVLIVSTETTEEQKAALREAIECPIDDGEELESVRPQFLNADTDVDIIVEGRRLSHMVLRRDPSLRNGKHAPLLRYIRSRWKAWDPTGGECPLPEPQGGGQNKRRRRRRRRS